MSSGLNRQGLASHLKLFFALSVALVMAGCGTTFKSVQTWEGPSAERNQIAILEKPGSVKVLSVNGRDMDNFLMDDIELNYELLPGQNTVVFTYKTIWAKKTVVEDGESKVTAIETDPQQVVINAQAGETYSFVVPEPQTQREAERLAENFQATIVNGNSRQVAQSTDYVAPKPQLPTLNASGQQVAPAPVQTQPAGASAANGANAPSGAATVSPAANGLPTLEGLKLLWERASTEEKKDFLRWAFQ
ncbi:hypothetical protein RE428_09830 [Marinobacter nanhaiticus D15-8W]|uniref:DUF2057 domain-containing protein n=1 Tax=Marinobacter nanhaiticus D15-8W TaxID=626887 RepID=N6WNL1_9GAMM|nr:DUF2057 family protein [Marinobacter nanhaiticus]ENO12627.2 DUF2057 domain-containing protein [Marinobacter nanhaiticus D15-8W]BES69965.1 hypothetical protein RE428_09830 [Marinobacter nanhaiticus D15-8W]